MSKVKQLSQALKNIDISDFEAFSKAHKQLMDAIEEEVASKATEGFKVTCNECGSDDVYMSLDGDLHGGQLTVICNNKECNQRIECVDVYTIKDGKNPLVSIKEEDE